MQKLGQARVSSDPSKNWDVQIRRRLSSSGPETLQSMMGSEARAQRASELSAAERPFAAGQEAKAWLDEASIPLEGSGASFSSLFEIPEGYSPSQIGVIGDKKFDDAAEEQIEQYQAGLASSTSTSQQPFAAGGVVKGWLEEATIPIALPDSSSSADTLGDFLEGYDAEQQAASGNIDFNEAAEEQTKQYLAALPTSLAGSQKPFAAGVDSPSWLEAASLPLVSMLKSRGI